MSEPQEHRPKLELSPIKIAAGAAAAATAAAIGSTLGVAGTIAGAAVASAVSASASAIIGHSLERGRDAAKKALPIAVHDPGADAARGVVRPAAGALWPSDRGLDAALRSDPGPGSDSALDATVVLQRGPDAETVLLPRIPGPGDGSVKARRLPGWKALAAATAVTSVIGIGAVSAYNLTRGSAALESVVTSPNKNQGGEEQKPPSAQPPNHGDAPTGKPTVSPSQAATPTPTPAPSSSTSAVPSTTPTTTPSTTNPSTTAPTTSSPPATPSSAAGSTPGATGTPAPTLNAAPPTTTAG